jgi:CBS domain-containing protein
MIKKEQICSVNKKDPFQKACNMIIVKHIGSVVVTDDNGSIIGIITKTDIVDAAWNGLLYHGEGSSTVAEKIMQPDVQYANENDDAESVAELMVKKRTHHILIKNDKDEVIGLTSALDIAKQTAKTSKSSFASLFSIPKSKK